MFLILRVTQNAGNLHVGVTFSRSHEAPDPSGWRIGHRSPQKQRPTWRWTPRAWRVMIMMRLAMRAELAGADQRVC
jgi:hypothetical protein